MSCVGARSLTPRLPRGSFEAVLADQDVEQSTGRWYSHTLCGQEFSHILAQWVWNPRLEWGQTPSPSELCTTELAQALVVEPTQACESAPVHKPVSLVTYRPPQWAQPSFTHGFPGSAFPLQPDGTLHCPAHHPLYPQERRPEQDGSLRVLLARNKSSFPTRMRKPRKQNQKRGTYAKHLPSDKPKIIEQ